jgi:hypothetical protein
MFGYCLPLFHKRVHDPLSRDMTKRRTRVMSNVFLQLGCLAGRNREHARTLTNKTLYGEAKLQSVSMVSHLLEIRFLNAGQSTVCNYVCCNVITKPLQQRMYDDVRKSDPCCSTVLCRTFLIWGKVLFQKSSPQTTFNCRHHSPPGLKLVRPCDSGNPSPIMATLPDFAF